MTIRINEACTEFGRTFTLGQVVPDLPPLEQNAMVLSGFASWIGANGLLNSHGLTIGLPDPGVVIPITSRQHANPAQYGLNQANQRTYQFGSVRVFWSGSAWVNLAA